MNSLKRIPSRKLNSSHNNYYQKENCYQSNER